MKKILLVLTLIISSLANTFGQVCSSPPNCIQNGNLDNSTSTTWGNMNWGASTTINDWYVSHGTPSLNGNGALFMWGSNNYGEGIFTCFNFDPTKLYKICIKAKYSGFTTQGDLIIKSVNNGLVQPILPMPSSGSTPPNPTNFELIDSVNITDPNYQTYTFTYAPTSSFNQLWIYPEARLPIG